MKKIKIKIFFRNSLSFYKMKIVSLEKTGG